MMPKFHQESNDILIVTYEIKEFISFSKVSIIIIINLKDGLLLYNIPYMS